MVRLVLKAQRGDEASFVKLMEQNKQGMYKVAKSYLHHEEDAADAMQETILTCFEKLDTLKEPQYFKTWMIRILINKCKDILQKNRELCLIEEMPETESHDMAQENFEFMELLHSIEEKYRTILILYYVEGFKIREIAELLDMNEHTVKTRLVRARKKFARECQDTGIYAGGQLI